jgi:hypothetical protein
MLKHNLEWVCDIFDLCYAGHGHIDQIIVDLGLVFIAADRWRYQRRSQVVGQFEK